jgi:serine/threonine protein kinase
MINTTIGKYKIIRLIGEGGMASVYEAEHEMLGTKVAIKVLNPILSANAQIKERFRNEAKLMASLDHPNITKVIDFDEQPLQLSIVMEHLNGEDLNQKIKRYGPLSEKKITDVFCQTLSAFQYAHEKGIVHRDIKPSNIFILPSGHVKILDFGIAKLFGQGNEMTQTGTQLGTPIYMSPEQVKADKSIDHRSDIYSLGVTLYFAINGKPPYNSDTDSQFDIFNKIVYESIPELTGTSYLNELIKKACNKDRDRRFQYCQEWIDAFSNKVVSAPQTTDKTVVEAPASDRTTVETQTKPEDKPITKSNSNAPETPKKPKNNKVLLFSILGVFASVLIIGGILFFGSSSEAESDITDKTDTEMHESSSEEAAPVNYISADTIDFAQKNNIRKFVEPRATKKYKISNNCHYPNDLSYESFYWIDGEIYLHNSEINLINGKHTIKHYLKNKSEGWEFNDETTYYINKSTSSEIFVDLNCACPFFYYEDNLTYRFGGELIRNLNCKKKEGIDYFELDKHFINSDTIRLLIKEEKDETSFLDEIYLKINDSLKVLPKSNNSNTNLNIMLHDGKYEILEKGTFFKIYFVIPKNIDLKSVKIYSYGYYLKNDIININ